MSNMPFFENVKIHEKKNLNDNGVAKDLKNDLGQLVMGIQNLPVLTKASLNFIGVNRNVFNAKKAMDNIVAENNINYNLDILKKNINNIMNILNKNKGFDSSIKSFLGENYLSKFKIVFDIVNNS